MNRTFKVIWNHTKHMWMVVGEFTKAQGKSKSVAKSSSLSSSAMPVLKAATLALGLGVAVSPAMAADLYWSGTTGGWTVTSNWNSGALPGASDTVHIENGGTAQIATGGAISTGWVYVGNSYLTTGSLEITNGSLTNYVATIADNMSSNGMMTVTGFNSSWTINSYLGVGSSGIGVLTISNEATVDVMGDVYLASYLDGIGTLNIGAAAGSTAVAAGNLNAASVLFGGGTGSIVFNHTDTAYSFAPAITGSGAVGLYSGTTRFTGSLSGFSGNMTVDGGTLLVADNETLTLGGDYTQTTNGTLKVGASSNASFGKLAVTGTATFDAGSKIDVDVKSVNTLSIGDTLSGVVTAGTLNASTFTLSDNSALLNFTATVNGNQIDLYAEKAVSVVDSMTSSGSSSGMGAARILDGFISDATSYTDPDMGAVVTALEQLETEAEVAQAVDDTLPILAGSGAKVATTNIHTTNDVIVDRQSGISSGDFMLANKHLWIKPVGNWTTQDKRNGVAGYKADSYGFVGGFDGDINDNTKLGFAVSYMNTDVKGKDTASGNKADIDAYQAIVYGSYTLANSSDIALNWQAGVGINKNEGSHYISFVNHLAKADYDSYTAHIGAGIERSFTLNDTTSIVPGIRADYAYIKDESYTETGSGTGSSLNLHVNDNSSDELIVTAQAKFSHDLNNKAKLIANAGIGYDLLNEQTSLTASYSGNPGVTFTTPGIDPSPWIGSAGAGINYNISDTSEITARYDVEGRSDFLSQTASVKFRWLF